MRNCREITELVSKGLDTPLGIGERLSIKLHVMMCSRCRNFLSQTQFIRKAARQYADQMFDSVKKSD
ncbi:zf-HC2 domain-containing protein [Methylomonas sp. SURF-2]|uniref:Zf-HC2 domain-containing protein n=1 Tax=Methylomonas subterranea TaxID=2952225 RepID=A0ABT1TIU8_9GAMM|nr:zf-HC2 domain-containing protein [Methylomonas sp. SURF-2]MCQ8105380.1 zf-HC2 domain-containing protein [Methylomonas sp. SURF-2]